MHPWTLGVKRHTLEAAGTEPISADAEMLEDLKPLR
jgi:hypothetical protein